MRRGAKIISRFAIFSTTETKESFKNIAIEIKKPYESLTFKNERVELINGKFGSLRKESSVEFRKDYENIYDIENCNNWFIENWEECIQRLKRTISNHDVRLILDYEITIYDSLFPSFVFSEKFIDFLSNINCKLTFYFYEGD